MTRNEHFVSNYSLNFWDIFGHFCQGDQQRTFWAILFSKLAFFRDILSQFHLVTLAIVFSSINRKSWPRHHYRLWITLIMRLSPAAAAGNLCQLSPNVRHFLDNLPVVVAIFWSLEWMGCNDDDNGAGDDDEAGAAAKVEVKLLLLLVLSLLRLGLTLA